MNDNCENLMNEQRKLMSERINFFKKGDDAINLFFYGEIDKETLNKIEEALSKGEIQFGYLNQSGSIQNCIDDFTLNTFFQISYPIIVSLTQNVAAGALWDLIKSAIFLALENNKTEKVTILKAGKTKQKKFKFGLKLRIDKNTELDFELDGNLDKEEIENSLDKILEIVKAVKKNDKYELPFYFKYENGWKKKDLQDYIKSKKKKK